MAVDQVPIYLTKSNPPPPPIDLGLYLTSDGKEQVRRRSVKMPRQEQSEFDLLACTCTCMVP